VAGVSIWWISPDAHLAFRGDVWISGVHPGTPDHGCAARLVEFLFDAFGMEARAGVSGIGVNLPGITLQTVFAITADRHVRRALAGNAAWQQGSGCSSEQREVLLRQILVEGVVLDWDLVI